jgi:hypothetical protein
MHIWPPGSYTSLRCPCETACSLGVPVIASFTTDGEPTVYLQVPVQRLLGLHRPHLVSQPPQVPVCDPLQRLGVGCVPARKESTGEAHVHRY